MNAPGPTSDPFGTMITYPQFEVIVQRASEMNRRGRRTLLEMSALRARADLALKHAANAVLRAHDGLILAADHLGVARERRGERDRAAGRRSPPWLV